MLTGQVLLAGACVCRALEDSGPWNHDMVRQDPVKPQVLYSGLSWEAWFDRYEERHGA